jgi:toxin ParE1/3/4
VNWDIEIADAAYEDMRNIFYYIANELQSPDDARNVIRRILAEIATLNEMPNRFRSYPREPLSSKGVRVMDVGNYCVYYIAKDGVVSVGRVLYFRRDSDAVLSAGWGS